MKIYTVTMLQRMTNIHFKDNVYLPDFGDRRCIGYFESLFSALNAIKVCNLHRKDYEYCIIEELPEGIYKDTSQRWLFKRYGNDEEGYVYLPCIEPSIIANVRNFSIG